MNLPPPPPPLDEDDNGFVLPPPPDSHESLLPPPPAFDLEDNLPPPPPSFPRASVIAPRLSVTAIPGPPPPLFDMADLAPPFEEEGRGGEAAESLDQVATLADAKPAQANEQPAKGSVKKLSLLFSGGNKGGKPPAPLLDMAVTPRSSARTRTESTMPSFQDGGEGRLPAQSTGQAGKTALPAKQETATVSATSAMSVKATYHPFAVTVAIPRSALLQREEHTGKPRYQNAQQEVLIIKAVNGSPVSDLEACRRLLDDATGGEAQVDAIRLDMHVICPKCAADFDLKAQRVFDIMSARCPACRQILSVDTKSEQLKLF
ncbi:hypothetical protein BASA81_002383 [Batrachochytrium salamandrivorans]|nr:hypothetical protein BASA81_002383 [Batrachochytrium salamandrivorans]